MRNNLTKDPNYKINVPNKTTKSWPHDKKGKVNNKDKPEFAINNWIDNNKYTMTFSDIKEQFVNYTDTNKNEYLKFHTTLRLIKYVSDDNDIITILEQIFSNKLLPKYNEKQMKGYSPFHIAAYVKTGCSYQLFTRLVMLLYSNLFEPFITNDSKETALMGLFMSNNKLEQKEREERYMTVLQNIPSNTIRNILQRCFNKPSLDGNSKFTDITRFSLYINVEQTMEMLANYLLISEKTNLVLGSFCECTHNKVHFAIDIITGANDNYKNVEIHDKSLEKFFELNRQTFPNELVLYNILYKKLKDIISRTQNEASKRNEIAFSRVVGSFVRYGLYVNECNTYLYTSMHNNNVDYAIHTITHVGYVNYEFKNLIFNIDSSVRIANVFDDHTLLNKTHMECICIKDDDELNLYDPNNYINKLENIQKIKCLNIYHDTNLYSVAVKDFVNQIKVTYDLYPNDQLLIVRQILVALIEGTTTNNNDNIRKIVDMLIKHEYITKHLVITEHNNVQKLINSEQLDCSQELCESTLKFILNLF